MTTNNAHTTDSRVQTTTGLSSNAHPIPTTAALDTLYAAANPVTGDQFVIYAPGPHDERGMYTVAHVTGPTDRVAIPRVHLVHPDDIAAYATGAMNRLRDSHAGHAVNVWLDRTTGPLHQHLTR